MLHNITKVCQNKTSDVFQVQIKRGKSRISFKKDRDFLHNLCPNSINK